MKSTFTAAAAFALFTSSAAHMLIQNPAPIAGSAVKDPLIADGSNFPCHGAALPGSGGTQMAVGSSQLLTFNTANGANTAAHGGGSCQLSLTYSTDPIAIKDPANWKVIYSIEGGCPTNSPLNLDGNFVGPQGTYTGAYQCNDPKTNGYDCANIFNFTIPQGVKNGQATLAWTWFNTIGNREMYMNCVAVEITGGSSDASGMSSLPNLFVANLASIGGGTCKTTEQQNVGFPNAGAYVLTRKASSNMAVPTAKDYPIVTPSGCGAAVAAATPAVASAPASSAPAAAPSPSSAAATTLATSAAATAAPATTKASSKSTASKKPAKNTVASASGTKATSAPAAAATPPTTNTSTCPAGSVACSGGVNSIICVDDGHFGICDYNACAISQAVAAGTMCKNGGITWAAAGKMTRHKRHMALHAKRSFF